MTALIAGGPPWRNCRSHVQDTELAGIEPTSGTALLAGSDPDARVAVFTHGMPINIVLSHVLGLEGLVHFPPAYGSITRLRVRGDGALGVVSVNETAHLA